ncbi:MAG: glycosyltransferase family 4 protein [Halobacteriota archaeon]
MKITAIAPFPKHKAGIPRVAEELITQLCEATSVDSVSIIARQDLRFVSPSILANSSVSLFVFRIFLAPRTFLRVIKLYKEGAVFLVFVMPWEVLHPKLTLYLFTLLIKYRFLPQSRWIQVLYDFIPYVLVDDTGQGRRTTRLYDFFKKHFLEIPARCVAVSESTKRDAMRYWGLSADKIDVIHLGSFIAPKLPRTRFGSRKILMVSDIASYKNHVRLLKAFERVHRDTPSAELIITGSVRKNVPEFEATLDDILKRNEGIRVRICGYVSDADIQSLYEEADVFVYPSLYEGFGLPVLEAMACGCPIIASNVSSLPEVVGEAGMLVDPYDIEALAYAVSTVLDDDELKREMSRKGIAQAQKFSWEKAGAKLLAVCREVTESSSRRKGDK